MTYRVLFASQWLPPLPKGCRVASVYHALALATDGETTLSAIGRTHDKAGRTRALRRGWRAFATQKPADGNGWPDQGDIVLIQDAIAPDLPTPRLIDTDDAESVWDLIGKRAVSIATDTGAVPAGDALRRFVGPVGHQFVAYKRKTINGTRYVKVIDPAHRHSNVYAGHWVRWRSLRKAAKAVPLRLGETAGGRIIAESYPIGGWSREALTRSGLSAVIGRKDTRIDILRAVRDAAEAEVAELTIQLAERREDADAVRLAARMAAFDAAIYAIQTLKMAR